MAEDKKAEDTAKDLAGAKPDDTAAETKKPDTDEGAKDSEAKKSEEPVAKVDDKNAKEGGKPAEKSTAKSAEKKPAAEKRPAAKKKKEKPPKLEDKPFNEFMEQHYLPSLKEAMANEGIDDLSLEFAKRKLEVMGQSDSETYWQVQGQWQESGEELRQFNIAFLDEDIKGQKIFTLTENDSKPSTIEQFMGDERRITLGLMVLYTVQRLNGQKWLTRN
ncbi:MAG: DUF2996 domain-containing protein [Cyanobacteria bacterium J06634_6]